MRRKKISTWCGETSSQIEQQFGKLSQHKTEKVKCKKMKENKQKKTGEGVFMWS